MKELICFKNQSRSTGWNNFALLHSVSLRQCVGNVLNNDFNEDYLVSINLIFGLEEEPDRTKNVLNHLKHQFERSGNELGSFLLIITGLISIAPSLSPDGQLTAAKSTIINNVVVIPSFIVSFRSLIAIFVLRSLANYVFYKLYIYLYYYTPCSVAYTPPRVMN